MVVAPISSLLVATGDTDMGNLGYSPLWLADSILQP